MALPDGVTQANFDRALRAFEKAAARSGCSRAIRRRALQRRVLAVPGEPRRTASAAAAPYTVEEVQAVVRAANTYRIPLYTISTGKNLGYGGSREPVRQRCARLERMNRILEISEKNASALIEPGVSYFDFYRYIQEHKPAFDGLPGSGWGSLIGNALDHGGGYTMTQFRITSMRTAVWKWCSRTASFCAPAWARCRTRRRGSSTSTALAR
jgi:4-cresol dehydrogenase (hydroxylating)